ncbi:MAG: hypothetical protein Q7U88_03945 [Desulfocapsaceae bacterium]|nr:hypothetical protein [Desulfocapsaceae bacterium]
MTMLGPVDPATVRKAQGRSSLFEQTDRGIQRLLFLFCQAVPPITELIGVFDFPNHNTTIASMEYSVNGI